MKMNRIKILKAYKQAEIDWAKHIYERFESDTTLGLCLYFSMKGYHGKLFYEIQKYWLKYATRNPNIDTFHFNSIGNNEIGRAERLAAIRKVIQDLEKPTWIQKFLNKYFRWISKKF